MLSALGLGRVYLVARLVHRRALPRTRLAAVTDERISVHDPLMLETVLAVLVLLPV